MKSALFLFCIKMANWLIINGACFVRENFAKNTVKNISKTLQVWKIALPLHPLSETHSDAVKYECGIFVLANGKVYFYAMSAAENAEFVKQMRK